MLKTTARGLILEEAFARGAGRDVVPPLFNRSSAPQVEFGEPRLMTDQAIEADYIELTNRAADIGRQLADDLELGGGRGDAWRRRAMGARRIQMRRVDSLLIEARRRNLAFVPAPAVIVAPPPVERRPSAQLEHERNLQAEKTARREAARQHDIDMAKARATPDATRVEIARLQAETAAAKAVAVEQEKTRRSELLARENREDSRLFILATKELLGPDATREIWAHVKTLKARAVADATD